MKVLRYSRLSTYLGLLFGWFTLALAEDNSLYQRFSEHSAGKQSAALERLDQAMKNPEYLLKHWVLLPTSAEEPHNKQTQHLSLREAILLALRYNPNIQNAELDRILQRYQLRLAENAFELQLALGGTAFVQNTHYSNLGSTSNKTGLVTPEVNWKSRLGSQLSLNMDNNVAPDGNYNPLLNFNISQPLLRGFGETANTTALKNAVDNEWLNKIKLKQAVMDQVSQVIFRYQALILSARNVENQQQQLKEAEQSFHLNEKKIAAGQLEPSANVQQSYQIESLKLMLEQANNTFRTNAQDLLQSLGLDPAIRIAVPDDVQLKIRPIPKLKTATQQALANNSQYLAMQVALKADERAYEYAKNQQLWELNATANIQTGLINGVEGSRPNAASLYNGRNTSQSAGLNLKIPIHDLNQNSQLISAKVQLEKDRLNLLAGKRALISQVKNSISTIESEAKRFQLAQKQVNLAEQAYKLEKKKQEAGIATALDVNNTQNQLLQAQSSLISAKIAYLNQMTQLQQILGTTLKEWQIKLRYSG